MMTYSLDYIRFSLSLYNKGDLLIQKKSAFSVFWTVHLRGLGRDSQSLFKLMQKSQGDFWSYQVVLEIQRKKRSGPMIIDSIEFATVTQHDVRE